MISGDLFSSSVLIKLTFAPCARASAMSGRLRVNEAQYSCKLGQNCFGSEKNSFSLLLHVEVWDSSAQHTKGEFHTKIYNTSNINLLKTHTLFEDSYLKKLTGIIKFFWFQ